MLEFFSELPPEAWETIARSLRLNGQSTSIRLERAFWAVLDRVATEQGRSTAGLISAIQMQVLEQHGEVRNFTSVLRCACLEFALRQSSAGKTGILPPVSRFPNGM